ncbi:MAG TPA: glycosyltransferase [Anaeromyxobacteraceae bacterium]|nr:glycosyltransferase [Anaeromyxobacteraceae bacterium]
MRLSLCLIARDEEKMLPGCLSSVQDVVDEMVVVDTGSRDATRAIASSFGAVVIDAPWQDDFSAPRNLAARRATGDFILLLDADERLAPGGGATLRDALRGADFDIGFVRLHNASCLDAALGDVVSGVARSGYPGLLPRVLRRTPDLEWRGVVHESVWEWWVRRGRRGARLEVDLVHLGGIQSVREERKKGQRNVRLLVRRCELEPEDPTALGYLAMELIALGQSDEAARVAERGWNSIDVQLPCPPVRRLAIARALCALEAGAPDRARESVERAAAFEGQHPDFAFLRACADELIAVAAPAGSEERRRGLEAAIAGYALALELLGKEVEQVIAAEAPRVLIRLGNVLLGVGRASAARVTFASAREVGGGNEAAWGEAEALAMGGDPSAALRHLEPTFDTSPDGWAVAALCARALGASADARLFVTRARACAPRGFASPLRGERLIELEAALGNPAWGQP